MQREPSRSLRDLAGDERGAMSLVTVLTLLLLTMLLGMVINVGRQANAKIKLQNAADAGVQAGGLMLARGMNSLAFSNNLLCDVCALTAFLREGRDKNAAGRVPEILDAWRKAGQTLSKSDFPKFAELGAAIPQMAEAEQQMVDAYSAWASAYAELVLPTLEEILAEEMLPNFDKSVVQSTPDLAQSAAMELGQRQGPKPPVRDVQRETPVTVLWRTDVDPVGGDSEESRHTLPVVDPVNGDEPNQANYKRTAVQQRKAIAQRYLNAWNATAMATFDSSARMSQFGQLWRGFTNGQLKKLLEQDYPDTNLPYVIRTLPTDTAGCQAALEEDYMFVGVAYRQALTPTMPGMFHDPLGSDGLAFAQGLLFIPAGRLMKGGDSQRLVSEASSDPSLQMDPNKPYDPDPGGHNWNLFCQNWTFHLVPATAENIVRILQAPPQLSLDNGALAQKIRLPQLDNLSSDEIRTLTSH
ncbi:MAG TPA: pilus assembly protein TadG-related protein [Pirellulales bacterium]|nr:pilus assembly protein TadG-related protein [Pirellulales bacterium]